jgi:branched-chain amino acid aminotransferase
MHIAINVNGRLTDDRQATISVFDHGFLYGEGVYETLRTYNRRPFLLDRHLDRLRASAAAIGLTVPLDDCTLVARIDTTMAAVDVAEPLERYVRLVLTRGVGDLSYDPDTCPAASLVIIARPHREVAAAVRERGIRVVVSSVVRNHPDALNPRIKSNNLLNNAMAMQEALRAGADEALMRNYRGEIAECAQSNVFLVRGGEALTPPLASGLLEGVTRNFLFEIGPEIGIPVRERTLRLEEIRTADEIFITSTTREVLPVTTLDGRPVGPGAPGPITQALAEAFRRQAHSAV